MNILFYTPNYLPAVRYGGPVSSVHGLARSLVQQGHPVEVLTSNVDGPELIAAPKDEPVLIDGVRVRYFPTTFPRRIYRMPELRQASVAAISSADIVHINGMFLWPGPQVASVARRLRKPYVVAPRGMLAPELIAKKSWMAKKAWIRAFDGPMLAGAAAIHLTSELERDGLIASGLQLAPTFIAPNGVALPETMPTDAEEAEFWQSVPRGRRVAFLSRLDWKKGADYAINAVQATPEAHLLLAGHDQIGLRARLEKEVHSCGAGNRIRFVGPLAGRQKWAFLAGADILIVPSINENFGNTVIEALGVGTSVICTEGVGAAEVLRLIDPSLVVPRQVQALQMALHTLLHDDEKRKKAADAGAHIVAERYSWNRVASEIATVFAEVASGRPLGGDRFKEYQD